MVFYGPANLELRLYSFLSRDKRTAFVIIPVDADGLKLQLDRKFPELHYAPFTDGEREAYKSEAANLLAKAASNPESPFQADLTEVESTLARALFSPRKEVAEPSAYTLGDVPDADAQRSLADAVLDLSRPASLRLAAAGRLVQSINKFGPLVSGLQEEALVKALADSDPSDAPVKTSVEAVINALKPKSKEYGGRLDRPAKP